jgi:hypothetical protein
MPEPGALRKLTKEEFQQLLQRAAERHTLSEPRDFTVAELVEAGRELGIDAATIEEVHREHERELALPRRQRPFDSLLRVDRGETFRLIMPASHERLGGAVLRTVTAAGLGVVASFSPFPWAMKVALWGIAVVIGYFSIKSARTTRELRLQRDGSGVLARVVGGRSRGVPLRAGQVQVRVAERTITNKYGSRTVPFLALDHGTETHTLLEGYSHAELAWAHEEIDSWLRPRAE